MKIKFLLLISLLTLFVFNTNAYDGMTTNTEYATIQAITTTLLWVDYRQTLDIKNHAGMYEKNILLGNHPSDSRIRNYFIGSMVGSAMIIYMLPEEYRLYWQGGIIGLELVTIRDNRRIGLTTMIKF